MTDALQTPDILTRTFESLRLRLHYVNRAWTTDNYESLLRFFVAIVPRLLDCERCSVFVVDPNTGAIVSKMGTYLDEQVIEPPLEGSIVGRAISSEECIIENGMEDMHGFHRTVDALTGFATRSALCAPIRGVAGGRVTGAIEVLNRHAEEGFSEDDANQLKEVAGYLSMALENIMLNKEILRLSGQLDREVSQLRNVYVRNDAFIAESNSMRSVLELVRMVSATPVNVLIQGENGTGKEVIARMIHEGGDRRDKPFVAVNCAAIPETLIESEFFGYEKGAFTGASSSRAGLLEQADGGTLFLDEIGDMPTGMQPKLLRAIQEGEGARLGGTKTEHYDLRLISASNRGLKQLVESNAFREDLYYRLFAVEITVPPLRERKDDIAHLALTFLDEVCRRFDKTVTGISNDMLSVFEGYDWPGNVRQLRREIERLVALTPQGQHLTRERCSPELLAGQRVRPDPESSDLDLPERVRGLEMHLIIRALEKTHGNKGRAAAELGITRQGLYKKLKRYEMS